MAHTVVDKKKLPDKARRIKGQVKAIQKALDEECDCSTILHNTAGCRGAMNGLMAKVVEGHIRSHAVGVSAKQAQAGDDLIELIKSYLK